MSNKLKKKSKNYDKVMVEIRKAVEEQGGINVTPEFMKKFTDCEDEKNRIKEDEFYEILAKLSEEGYKVYKVSCVTNGKETRGMMICNKKTTVAFVQTPESETEN